ncbi:MAG: Na/Pi cotransporter family protein, partial [Huintestinicola sp.]
NYIYPIIFIGFILYFVSKSEKVKNVGMVIFSFGLLFEGIEIMGGVMKPLAGSPIFTDLMGKVAEIPVLGILLGAVMTVVVQSSSATIAVLQNFASQAGPDGVTSVIGLAGAIPILLGDNIGTTITALLASIGQSKNAKRTAIAHSVFNISGSILFAFLIPVLAKFVQYISPKGNEVDVIARQIANAHTTFNIVCTLIWLPLIPIMVKIVMFIVRGEDKNVFVDSKPRFLDEKLIGQPVAAMYLVSEEIRRISEFGAELMKKARALFDNGNSEVVRADFGRDYGTVCFFY